MMALQDDPTAEGVWLVTAGRDLILRHGIVFRATGEENTEQELRISAISPTPIDSHTSVKSLLAAMMETDACGVCACCWHRSQEDRFLFPFPNCSPPDGGLKV